MGLTGERIKELRLLYHMTQDDVAKFLGIGKQAVYKYESGAVTNIPLENIEKMATLFNTTPEYLAGWADDKNVQNSKHYMNLQLFGDDYPSASNADEQNVLKIYRSLSDEGKRYIHDQLSYASYRYGNGK